jgi:hypothetical protein
MSQHQAIRLIGIARDIELAKVMCPVVTRAQRDEVVGVGSTTS